MHSNGRDISVDTFGRRNLLLTTLPLLAGSLLLTGFGFWAPEGSTRTGIVATGIYVRRARLITCELCLSFYSYSWCSTRRVWGLFPLHTPQRHPLCISVIWECRWLLRSVGYSSEPPVP